MATLFIQRQGLEGGEWAHTPAFPSICTLFFAESYWLGVDSKAASEELREAPVFSGHQKKKKGKKPTWLWPGHFFLLNLLIVRPNNI